jgi:two-component system OmpR family sensor kinase
MKPLFASLYSRLYFRLWLAVVAAVLLAVTLVMVAWLLSAERQGASRVRQLELRNPAGDVVGVATTKPPRGPGQGLEFTLTLNQTLAAGEPLVLELPKPLRPPRADRPDGDPRRGPMGRPTGWGLPDWLKPPFGFVWWMMIAGVAVALAAYPVIRRLTSRLEALEQGVQRWGMGDLSVRLPVQGNDEVASLTRRFNAAAEQIEQLLLSHKTLLANASHELRSPLARIRMGMELLVGDAQGLGQRKLSDEINRSINELDQLVGEILLASRLDAANADIGPLETVDLTGLVAEEAARTHAELDAEAVQVTGSAKLLRRLVRNLLDNAAKYASAAGAMGASHGQADKVSLPVVHITLTRRTLDGTTMAILQVDDQGPGVPVDQRERIFEPFYRMSGASEKEGGVGLGLALVKSIARRHGGEVRCEERPGGGARFVVELPLQAV